MNTPQTDRTQPTRAGEPSGGSQSCPASASPARDAAWHSAASRARLLSWLSLAYMSAEAAVAIVASALADSVALLGFGLDSAIKRVATRYV